MGRGELPPVWRTAAEHITVPREKAVPLPDEIDFTTGACLGISARTAHRCVFVDGRVAGHTVLVAGGAGNVGHVAVALASSAGATVIATLGSRARAEMVRGAGAAVAQCLPLERVVEAHELVEADEFTGHILLDISGDAAGEMRYRRMRDLAHALRCARRVTRRWLPPGLPSKPSP